MPVLDDEGEIVEVSEGDIVFDEDELLDGEIILTVTDGELLIEHD
jgi:hypothetical protein